jgi:malate dehydrogenase
VQLSPALSAAAAICSHVHDWLLGTRPGEFVSMGVITDRNNSYGIVPGLVYSFPVECSNGKWSIVKGGCCTARIMPCSGICMFTTNIALS